MFSGHGPGMQAPDGCSVELYRHLPYLGDLDAIRPILMPGASVLELGCGTGRLTRILLGWGLHPTSVDNSPNMLAELPTGARPVLSSIESLELAESFDLVLLASCLINHPNEQTRDAFLSVAAKHLRPGAQLFVERHDPQWLRSAKVGKVGTAGPAEIYLESVERTGSVIQMRLRYTISNLGWVHAFAATPLTTGQIESLLSKHGFESVSWHGPSNRWAAASTRLHNAT